MANERKTESIIRKKINKEGYRESNNFLIEEQVSDNPKIKKLLGNASKSGKGNGKPEFIITKKDSNTIIIIECKALLSAHKTDSLNNPKDYACDGVLHYASYLKDEYNVIAIGASGETEKEIIIDTYLWIKGDTLYKNLNINEIKTFNFYEDVINKSPDKKNIDTKELLSYAKTLHEEMRDIGGLRESEKPLVVSAILIALKHKSFEKSFVNYERNEIAEKLLNAVEKVLENAKIPEKKKKAILTNYAFIESYESLVADYKYKKNKKETSDIILKKWIKDINEYVKPFISMEHSIDIIGKFYEEFLRYSGGDGKGLGIVLTPNHITDLFADIANIDVNSRVLDIATGTGGLLISAMKKMFDKANGDVELIEKIKKENLIGVEKRVDMYALACSNMILRGDGKSNLYNDSCFDIKKELKSKKATVGLMNPPYSQKGEGLSELDFTEYMLDCLEPNGIGVVIVPMSCAIKTKNKELKIRQRILKKHSLLAVMSMPDELFYPTATVTCIMVFKAHVPHDSSIESWFGYWKDDGFLKTRNDGRVDINNVWIEKKEKWLDSYKNKRNITGFSINKSVTAEDEWCAEAYIDTDYKILSKEMFEKTLKKYLLFKIENDSHINGMGEKDVELQSLIERPNLNIDTPELNTDEWKVFTMSEVFDIQRGKGCNEFEASLNLGNTLFVTATESNNGVKFKTNLDATIKKNCITVANNGSVGASYYQDSDFISTTDISVLRLKNYELNKYIALFLTTVISLERFKFNYGRKWGISRMNDSYIKLPVDENGKIDYLYMENYIKTLKYSNSI